MHIFYNREMMKTLYTWAWRWRSAQGMILLLISFAPACGLIQGGTKIKESSLLQTAQLQQQSGAILLETRDSMAKHEFEFEDSSGSYQVEIWPEGPFSFKPGQGFEAGGGQVRIRGQQSRALRRIKEHTAASVQKQAASAVASKQESQVANQQRMQQKRNPAWGWALILLAVLLIFERFFTKNRYPFVQ